MYQQCGPALHAMFHPLWLYPADYVNEHDVDIAEERARSGSARGHLHRQWKYRSGVSNALLEFDRRSGLGRSSQRNADR